MVESFVPKFLLYDTFHRLHLCVLCDGHVGFSLPGGGGVNRAPKNWGGGFGKRAQLTDTILTKEKVRIHGGNFDFEVAIFDQSF